MQGQNRFAVSDVEYNLITTLSNLLQAEDVLNRYKADADSSGDADVAALFNEIQEANNIYARRLREKLHDQFMRK